MSTRLPINPTPETFVTTRVPRTRKFYLTEVRSIPFKVPEQRGIETEWSCSKVEVYKPDGNKVTINNGDDKLTELSDGVFMAMVTFNMLGLWTIIFYYGPEGSEESFQYRMRARVVA